MKSTSNWHPTATLATLRQRAKIMQLIRKFFLDKNILEVETPLLSQYSVTDVQLNTFKTEFCSPFKNQTQDLYLITSPEYHMKRLLAAGSGSIFQICKVFRNEEVSKKHNPEFSMLEWYRINFSMFALIAEIDQLLQLILNTQTIELMTYQDAFKTHLNLDPLSVSKKLLENTATKHGLYQADSCSYDTLLQFLFSEIVEPKIGKDVPIAIYNFPCSQAALAKISQDDTRVAERFEVYYQGIELANGFSELTDAKEQELRFSEDNLMRAQLGLTTQPIDLNFIQALNAGMPDCSGVALGLDRLIMLALNKSRIDEVLSFTVNNA